MHRGRSERTRFFVNLFPVCLSRTGSIWSHMAIIFVASSCVSCESTLPADEIPLEITAAPLAVLSNDLRIYHPRALTTISFCLCVFFLGGGVGGIL